MPGPVVIAAIAAFLIISWLLRSPWLKGVRGERYVRHSLRRLLDENEYRLFNDLLVPTADGATQIDHVITSRFGIFVVETKNMQGWIFGNVDEARWTQVIFHQKSQFQNPIRQNFRHLKTLQILLGIHASKLHSIVAFVGSAEPKTDMPDSVVWDVRSLAEHVQSKRMVVFTENQLRALEAKLSNEDFKPTMQSRRAHIRRLKSQTTYQTDHSARCPRCGAQMTQRSNRRSGEAFLACTRYPDCRGTRQLA